MYIIRLLYVIVRMLYVNVYCIYYYVNKFEARSLFSTSHLKVDRRELRDERLETRVERRELRDNS